jgi:muramidase (phage lysozyme)
MARITATEAGGANVVAFLDMIGWSELGPGLMTAATDDGYRVCVGSTPSKPILFSSYATHPRTRSARMNSDAAGRYQLMGRYWEPYRKQLALPDFGPVSQDKIAIQLIRECHALDLVKAGRIPEAVHACASRWASFPGAGYEQPEHTISDLAGAFTRAGGRRIA